jgi:BirA family biotin operon repressor/biotin-[acetyl-CoA-carboxylase] ligase
LTARSPWPNAPQYWLHATDSTMLDAGAFLRAGTPHGTLVVADYQRAGHGTAGRRWVSSRGSNLLFNVVLAVDAVAKPSLLPLYWGVAIAAAIDATAARSGGGSVHALVKWPNDVLVGGAKVAGVLCERHGDWFNTGVGVTCNQRYGLPGGPFPAKSLRTLLGARIERLGLLELILWNLEAELVAARAAPASRHAPPSSLEQRLYGRGKEIRIENAALGMPAVGTLIGLTADGALVVRDRDGGRHHHYSGRLLPAGEVSGA